MYVFPKAFSKSRTIRFNGLLVAIAVFLAGLPETVQAPPLSQLVAMLPEHWRHVIAAVISVIAAINVLFRLLTTGPVNLPGGGPR